MLRSSDLMGLPAVDCDKSFAMQLVLEDTLLTTQTVYFQVALLYPSFLILIGLLFETNYLKCKSVVAIRVNERCCALIRCLACPTIVSRLFRGRHC